jgi:hypothetical protein
LDQVGAATRYHGAIVLVRTRSPWRPHGFRAEAEPDEVERCRKRRRGGT